MSSTPGLSEDSGFDEHDYQPYEPEPKPAASRPRSGLWLWYAGCALIALIGIFSLLFQLSWSQSYTEYGSGPSFGFTALQMVSSVLPWLAAASLLAGVPGLIRLLRRDAR